MLGSRFTCGAVEAPWPAEASVREPSDGICLRGIWEGLAAEMPLEVLEDGDPELSMSGDEGPLGALAPSFPGSCPAHGCQAGAAWVTWRPQTCSCLQTQWQTAGTSLTADVRCTGRPVVTG